MKTLGVLTSGGDCAGLNAVIRAVAYHAIRVYGWKVIGIQDGTAGLIDRPLRYRELTMDTFDGRQLGRAGIRVTILGHADVTKGARTLDPVDALIGTARGLGIHPGEQRTRGPEQQSGKG